jgi:hypothetical protein
MTMYDGQYDVMMSMSEHLKNDMMITTIKPKYKKKCMIKKFSNTWQTTLRRHDVTWHDMMTTRWTQCTHLIMILKKK